MSIKVFVMERQKYKSNEVLLRIDAKSFVYELNPRILATDTREVKVYVSEHMNRTY
jgi:hypothetical protein